MSKPDKPTAAEKEGIKIVATNRKAGFNYELETRYEAGMVLLGSEIKAVRLNHVNLSDGYVQEVDGELWLMGVNIARYEQANRFGHEPTRPRKLLLRKEEIARLLGKIREKGYTLVPTRMYLKRGRAKVEIALARGKKQFDKRDAIADRESKRSLDRALKEGRFD
jgi:SsrA-binding protein